MMDPGSGGAVFKWTIGYYQTGVEEKYRACDFVTCASAVTSAKALTACAWEVLPKSEIWTLPHDLCVWGYP